MKVCKGTYVKFQQGKHFQRSHKQKWANILNKDINEELWCKLFSSNFRCTIESKLRSFQYQILLRSLPTNKSLKEWKIKNSDLCFYCNLEPETIEHLFWICPIINAFWKSVINKLEPFLDIKSFVNPTNILLGCCDSTGNILINHIFVIVKRYIYISKCMEKSLSIDKVLGLIKYYHNIELNMLVVKGRPDIFESKWSKLTLFFNSQC